MAVRFEGDRLSLSKPWPLIVEADGQLFPSGVRLPMTTPTHRWGTGARDRTSTTQHQKQRQRILYRDHYTCQLGYADICVTTATEMDHIVNVKAEGSDEDENMQAVCQPCHARKSALEGVKGRNAQRAKRKERLTLPKGKHPGLL